MFEQLGDKLSGTFQKLRGQGQISEENIKDALKSVKMALLEADANFKVVRQFTARVKEKALNEEVLRGVKPGQQFVKIVNDELVELLGGEAKEWKLPAQKKPAVVMLLGLQGSGKTTFSGKLVKRFQKEGRKPMLVACDVHRPAAINQLKVVGEKVGAPVFEMGQIEPVKIAEGALKAYEEHGCDTLIFDTAGRLHIDEVKMEELLNLKKRIEPDFSFFVADAMTGQDAVNSADAFHTGIGVDGVCLTKMDGDARGGAALSIKEVTGQPIVFVGVGEKPEDLELFRPEGIVSRMLGMGDVVSLVEKAQEQIDEKEAEALAKKMRKQQFSLGDFLSQLQKIKKMGSLKNLIGMIPGMSALKDVDVSEKDFSRIEAMILSMTPEERDNPDLINGSRRARIAKGSGTTVPDINGLLQQFGQMKKMMSQMMGMTSALPGGGAGGAPGEDGEYQISEAAGRHLKARMTGRNVVKSAAFERKKKKAKAAKRARKKKKR